jgi:hypothetical protein
MIKISLLLLALPLSCLAHAQLPDARLTPGVIRTTSAAEICAKSFRTKPFRLTTAAMKKQVCAAYHVKQCPKLGTLELDHLVPLELGGLDDVRNLWPQMARYPGSVGFHVKDKLENELKRRVCKTKSMTLPEAQQCLQSNWVACYQRTFGATSR